jgi:hypothetical protein
MHKICSAEYLKLVNTLHLESNTFILYLCRLSFIIIYFSPSPSHIGTLRPDVLARVLIGLYLNTYVPSIQYSTKSHFGFWRQNFFPLLSPYLAADSRVFVLFRTLEVDIHSTSTIFLFSVQTAQQLIFLFSVRLECDSTKYIYYSRQRQRQRQMRI